MDRDSHVRGTLEFDDDMEARNLLGDPLYKCSSTGSLKLIGAQDSTPATTFEFEALYRKPDESPPFLDIVKKTAVKKCRKLTVRRVLSKNFPTLGALRRYKVFQYLPNDMVAGLTAGITMIPQGMAFASLSTLPPIIGLYISLFASLTYFFLGTCHQLSWGCVAVLSILMGNILDKYQEAVRSSLGLADSIAQSPALNSSHSSLNFTTFPDGLNTTLEPGTVSDPLPYELSLQRKIEVACSVSMTSGIILAVLGKLGLGRVTSFMSDSLITSFTVGVSFHVVSSQIKTALGLNIPRQSGIFKLIRLWVSMLSNIHQANPATIIISLICIAILYTVKRFVNEKYKSRMRVPIPIELFVVIIVTVVTAYTGLAEDYEVSVVKEIPVGVPSPKVPDLSLSSDFIVDGLIIIIVSFTQNIAMAKMMGLKHNYRIDSNQEMFACGVVSMVCSVFSGYISGPSVSRSMVQDGAGGKTQVASLFAAALVLLVIMLVGPYFYYLPNCVLASIIIVNLRSIFLKITTVPALWRQSRVDALVWIITCAATVILETDIGLIVGVVFCIIFVLMRSQVAIVDVISEFSFGDVRLWKSEERYLGGRLRDNVKVIRINSALYFANAEIMTDQVFKKTGINPMKIKKDLFKSFDIQISGDDDADKENVEVEVKSENHVDRTVIIEEGSGAKSAMSSNHHQVGSDPAKVAFEDKFLNSSKLPFTNLIIDLNSVPFMDVMGVHALQLLVIEYEAIGIKVYFSNVQEKCADTLQKTGFLTKYKDIVFLSTDAAIRYIYTILKV